MEKKAIYIDIEDDITAVISKVEKSTDQTVNMVIPKRSTVLQSVVNLKLVKKAAREAEKELALITDDSKINRMAAQLGLMTAPNLKAEPTIPVISDAKAELPSDVVEDFDSPGPPAQAQAPSTVAAKKVGHTATAATLPPGAGQGKSKIPDFNRFRKRLILGGLGILGLGVIIWLSIFALPKAVVQIQGRTETQQVDFGFTVDREASRPNVEQGVLPGTEKQLNKTLTSSFKASGKKDAGTKASGTLSVKNCEDTDARSLSAETRFESSSGRVFLTSAAATIPAGTFSGGGSTCTSSSVDIGVSALENGDNYNIGATSYSSSALSGNFVITGTAMTGGSSKTVTVVTQADVDTAKDQLLQKERSPAQKELEDSFSDDDYIIKQSFAENPTDISPEPAVGGEADSAKLTLKVTYAETAVKQTELKALLKYQLEQAGKKRNSELGVVDDGLDKAQFVAGEKIGSTAQRFQIRAEGLLGPDINFDELKERIARKRSGEAEEIIKSYPEVTGATVKLQPFWVRRVPSNPSKVIIEINIPQNQ